MANYLLCLVIFKLILPVVISTCVTFRPSGLSAIYFLFLCYLPLVPVPTRSSMSGHTGIYLKILLAVSFLTALCQLAFQITLMAMPPYAHFLKDCELLEKILRHVGFVRLNNMTVTAVLTWITPEIIMLAGSIAVFVLCNKLAIGRALESTEDGSSLPRQGNKPKRSLGIIASIGKYAVLLCLCLAAVLRPSVPGGLYFLIFLATATWWACYKQLGKGYAIMMRCLMVVVFLHMSAFYTYQFQWPQELLEANSTYARYFGLTPILRVECPQGNEGNVTNGTADGDPRDFIWNQFEWATYVNPIALFLLFYILAVESKMLLKPQSQKKQGHFARLEGTYSAPLGRQMSTRISSRRLIRSATTKHRWQSATRKVRESEQSSGGTAGEKTPLIRGVSPSSRRYGSGSKKSAHVLQDSTGSVTITGENPDEIPMEQLGKVKGASEEEYEPTVFENVMYAFESILQLIIRSSYIGTNIIMMAWSITYLSWITFVLLIWANLLWLVPNQRKSMLRSSPFLVFYAWFLLISAYIYSMDLTEEELPSKIDGVNLAQIGFQKFTELPCNPLLVKCLFTAMFWVTLRQFMQERMAERQSSALADMVAPLQVTVGTATGVSNEQEHSGSKIMEKIGRYLKKFLTKFWIWVVAITLFAVAITGEKMTAFRILYMTLFLFFVLSFQMSFRIWRRMMFGFWLTVIVYSMIILILVYTYQFDGFPDYWEEYIHVTKQRQEDIGLEKFDTKQLFIRLVTPTFFVIITVIQLHYFHKDFMDLSDPKNTSVIGVDLDESSLQGGVVTVARSDKDDTTTSSVRFDLTDIGHMSTVHVQHVCELWLKRFHRVMNLAFMFLELHMPKVVLFFAMLVCVYDKCALYLLVVILLVLALTTGRPMQVFTIYASSVFVSLMLLARMIYQIKYIDPNNWNVTCEVGNGTEIENNAKWLGFYKTDEKSSVFDLVIWNIVYILLVTLWSVVLVRQYNYKVSRGKPTTRIFFMFPRITRAEADLNLINCLKYLANYGFYKFGVEICLMATVALIGFRMDLYAVFYAVWLCILFNLKRRTLARIWNFYMAFIALFIGIQYIMAVSLPPTLCILYPWDKEYWDDTSKAELFRRLQDFAYLLDTEYPPSAKKLICDFVLLLLVSRQSVVFRIEKRHAGQEYSGGSNESIVHFSEQKGFENPVPDFVTYCRSYLDVFKRATLLSFLWITLAIVFLAGTNRVNIFSIGYLVGAFVFLWQGTDLYLKPIPSILKSWDFLVGYNVAVILIKTGLQLVGCVFLHLIPSYSCWLIQLLGIGCVRKFGDVLVDTGFGNPDANECTVPREFIGLVWDGLCFGFLIMQRRLFQSYNFFHMVDEAKAASILASRGAELIEELRQKRMSEQEEQERRVLEKIKAKMDRIKATQQKIQGASYKDTTNHYVARPPLARSTSTSSCASQTSQTSPAGYHTPIEDDGDEDELAPLTPRSSLMQPQVPSPFSAVMTVSLEGYLEPQRISFSSPPNSDLNPRPPSPDDSFPVFSPPPYDAAPPYAEAVTAGGEPPLHRQPSGGRHHHRQSSIGIGPPWMQGSFVTPRQSVISYSSRSPLSHHEYAILKGRPKHRRKQPGGYKEAIRSGDYYMFDDLDDDNVELIEDDEQRRDEDEQDEDNMARSKKFTVGQLLSTAMKSDITATLRRHSETDVKRRMSMPLSRQRSVMSARSQLSAPYSAPPTIEEHIPRSVTIKDDRKKDYEDEEDEPQPGTSKDEEISELSEPRYSLCQRLLNYLLFAWAFIESSMISLTNFLNQYSKDYRYVLRVLTKEKKILKENTDYTVGLRLGTGQMWQPAGSYHSLLRRSRMTSMAQQDSDEKQPASEESDTKAMAATLPYTSDQDRRKASVLTVPEIRILAPSLERGLDSPFPSESGTNLDLEEYEGTEMSSYDQPTVLRLVLAMWYIVMSRSELVCYFIIFLNQIKSATFLSLPLPLMVFFWGTLTVPRPTKTFWVTIIAYTEVIVLIKCMFQFDIIPWNSSQSVITDPFYPTRIIGIERNKNYAVWDLLLLLVVFFHRFMLKSMGLWKTSAVPAVLLSEGDYRIGPDGEMEPLDDPAQSLHKRSSKIQPKAVDRTSPPLSRRSSDLQRLVEETEDHDEEDNNKEDKEKNDGDEEDKEEEKDKEVKKEASEDLANGDRTASFHFSSDESEKIVAVTSQVVEPSEHFPQAIQMATSKYAESFKTFFQQLIDPTSRVAADVYSYMFMCDFFNFFVILIGYSSFGTQQGDQGVSAYLEDDKVPVLFLLMLILQFMLIIIDRGIFLRKNILAKAIFQFVQVIILHIWLFIIFPIITDRSFNSVVPPQMYYMVKCFYLLLSAYQIRCGYPTRILGNFLCKGYNYLNMFLFKGFMVVPFLFELRTIMDWMWTDTSMTVFDWIKMEDIFAHIFQLKCSRHVEDEYPQPRGEKKNPVVKYAMGGAILFVIIAIIWFPLVFFSLGNAVGTPNTPYDVTLQIRIGPYEPVYTMSAQSNFISQFTEGNLQKILNNVYNTDKIATTFISNYEAEDIAAVKLSSFSANIWSISPPDRTRMVTEVNSTNPITVRLEYKVSHKTSKPEDSGIIPDSVEITIPAMVNVNKTNPVRQNLLKMLLGDYSGQAVTLDYILPKFLKVTNKGTAKPVTQLMLPEPVEGARSLRNISLRLNASAESSGKEWWKIEESCTDSNYKKFLSDIPFVDCSSIILYTFNDKIFPSTLSIITTGGIVGLYTTLVFVASRILKGFFVDQFSKIMFDDMPNVDRVLQLCLDIYLVREAREFALEEDLFAKLVFLFRSPETLIKWTRPKEEEEDDEDPEGEGA